MDTYPDVAILERRLREATTPAGVRALVDALGIPPSPPTPAAAGPRTTSGAPATDGAGDAHGVQAPATDDDALAAPAADDAGPAHALATVGERAGLLAVLAVLDGRATPELATRAARRVRAVHPVRPLLVLLADAGFRRLTLASFGLDGELRRLTIERDAVRRSDLEALAEMRARPEEGGVELLARHARALDRSRVTRQFFRDVRAHRARIADAWTGLPADLEAERDQLALLFLSRLIFLYFLQRDGHLAGDRRFLPRRVGEWRRGSHDATAFRAVLVPLFFGALNTRPEKRSAAARRLGPLPYLNGGLFERHPLERRFPELDLADGVTGEVFDRLLERYRFTTREPADAAAAAEGTGDVGIDPETLGRVFEELMAPERRGATGTFYTPVSIVDRLVRETLVTHLAGPGGRDRERVARLVERGRADGVPAATRARIARAVDGVRVIDPACGSGAFLIGALSRLCRVRAALEGGDPRSHRRAVVRETLYGVDLLEDAALLCALRLWLALTDTREPVPPPLPNLDRRIRQGDALVDPLDAVTRAAGGRRHAADGRAWRAVAADADVLRASRTLAPLARRYTVAGPDEKAELRRELARAEHTLAASWLRAVRRRLDARSAELRTVAAARDLFGARPADSERAERALATLEARTAELDALERELDDGALPFFSFPVHFAEATATGFDVVLSNPPWVRAHRWSSTLREVARRRYRVCRDGGWRRGAELIGAPAGVGAQTDLSLLFLERAIELLRPGGTLGMLLPAKSLRSLYGAGARRMLLEDAELALVEDHALDAGGAFRADAFSVAVVARRAVGAGDGRPAQGAIRSRGAAGAYGTADAYGAAEARRADENDVVRVVMARAERRSLRFTLHRRALPVLPDDPESPWLLAPPGARAAFRRMQRAGPPLAAHHGLRIRRGVMTGANDVLVAREVQPKLGGLARINAQGRSAARRKGRSAAHARRYTALIESAALRPLVRGRDLAAWSFRVRRQLVWVHDDRSARPGPAPKRTERYLRRHARALRARSGWRPSLPLGAVFRASPATLGAKVLWHDLADTLKAVASPARVRGIDGRPRPLVPLNTVYCLPVDDDDRALLLAAYLNARPFRTFARAIAQRAKDARFRFLAWTVGLVPLPHDWADGPHADRLLRISRAAHRDGGIDDDETREALDATVAASYGLTPRDRRAIAAFDRWLGPAREDP
ncbi:MAG: Eco57I restriction-modification methylase domain-containing protein [Gemmatimonadota bacterium]